MGKLQDRMKGDLLLKAYSPHTQSAYLRCARHFASHYMRSPEEMGEQEVRDFLLYLVRDRKASPGHVGHVCQRPQVPLHHCPQTTRGSKGYLPIQNGLKPSRSFSVRKRSSESLRPSAR